MIILRDFKLGDEKNILELFKESFNKSMDNSFWKWRYQNNILNKIMIKLAIDEEKLAAHYAVSPTQIYIDGKRYNSAISMTTMTHPNYRGLGLFTKLANELYESHKEDLDVIYGVPNDNSLKGFIKYMNFQHIKDIPVMRIDLTKVESQTVSQCKEIKRFNSEFDTLFNKIKYKYKVILSRDSKYLNWRFCENPINQYKIITYQNNGELMGYAVSKVFTNGDLSVGDIVDIVAINTEGFQYLIKSVCSSFFEKGITSANIWMNNNEYIEVLEKIGFTQTNESFHFIVRAINNEVYKDISEFSNWYITMSDIDIF